MASSSAGPSSSRRSKSAAVAAEIWDDDFDFDLEGSAPAPAPRSKQQQQQPSRHQQHHLYPQQQQQRSSSSQQQHQQRSPSSKSSSSTSYNALGLGQIPRSGSRTNAFPIRLDSSDESDEDWDLPGSSRIMTATYSNTPRNRGSVMLASPAHLQPQRSSPSLSPTLPNQPFHRSSALPVPTTPQSSSRNRLRNRQSSVGLGSSPVRDGAPQLRHSPGHKSSPNLADMDRMSSHAVARAKLEGNSTPQRATSAATPSTPKASRPLSPTKRRTPSKTYGSPELSHSQSTEHLKSSKKGFSNFWKRLSAGANSPSNSNSSPDLRKRSSFSAALASRKTNEAPPVPPLPPNMRTPSSSSAAWSVSSSQQSTPSSAATSKGAPKRFSAMIRRSSSNLAAHAAASPKQPLKEISSISSPVGPTIHTPYSVTFGPDSTVSLTQMPASSMQSDGSPLAKKPSLQQLTGLNSTMSTSSVNLIGNVSQPRYRTTSMGSTQPPTQRKSSPLKPLDPKPLETNDDLPRTFSPGFHLPSTTPSSPYRNRTLAGSVTSFQQQAQGSPSPLAVETFPSDSSSDTETEESAVTGRTKSKPAPPVTTAIPVPRVRQSTSVSSGLRELHNGTSDPHAPRPSNVSSMSRSDIHPKPRQFSNGTTTSAMSQDSTEKPSTLRRITSFSKKHGRRLSGGWKFGQGSNDGKAGASLETVSGSPSKPDVQMGDERGTEGPPVPAKTAFPSEPRTSNSVVRKKAASHEPGTGEKRSGQLNTAFSFGGSLNPEDASDATPKQSKRRSQQDFVIPDNVLAKQKDLKRGITSVKKFAGGVQSLKSLVESHERVCNSVLTNGTADDTRLFVDLENEYAQWWEMATVLIEVGSTGTQQEEEEEPESVRLRRITLAANDARAAGEALRSLSGSSSAARTALQNYQQEDGDVFTMIKGPPRQRFGSAGRHDLSKRQLEVLRTMLRTPVANSESVVPSVDHRQAETIWGMTASRRHAHQSMPPMPTSHHTQPRQNAAAVLDHAKSPKRAAASQAGFTLVEPPSASRTSAPAVPTQAKPQTQTRSRSGLAGLRDFLRSLKGGSNKASQQPPAEPAGGRAGRRRPPPLNLAAADAYPQSPPMSPNTDTGTSESFGTRTGTNRSSLRMGNGSPSKTDKRRRPSLRGIFRGGSGNWSELVKSPTSGAPLTPVQEPHSSNASSQAGLSRPPSIPALSRLKTQKGGEYGQLGIESPPGSPIRTSSEPRVPRTPPPNGSVASVDDATLRLRSRVLGLGHPSESSPGRTASSPVNRPLTNGLAPAEDKTPRSRSDTGPGRDETVIALTPENLPVLLDYVRQCERKLDEWKGRAHGLEDLKPLPPGRPGSINSVRPSSVKPPSVKSPSMRYSTKAPTTIGGVRSPSLPPPLRSPPLSASARIASSSQETQTHTQKLWAAAQAPAPRKPDWGLV